MKTLIMSAMELETSKIQDLIKNKSYKNNLDILVTGVGKVSSAVSLSKYLEENKDVKNIVLIGFAGGLKVNYTKGDLIFVTKAFQHDFGILKNGEIYRHKPSFIDLKNKENKDITKVLYKLSHIQTFKSIKTGTIATGDIFANDTNFSKGLSKYADLVDMETGAITQVLDKYYPEINLYSLRVISDSASDSADMEFSLSISDMLDTLNKGTETVLDYLYS